MATIYSNRNDGGGSHSTVSALSTSTWAGGVVPVSADTAYVVGRRTQTNQSSRAKWTSGTVTITVDSTSNFASSGFFYTCTNAGETIKVNYTGTTATTFTGCTLDLSDPYFAWDWSGSVITDNTYVINPAYVIEIGTGQTLQVNYLYIQEGGYLFINGGTLIINIAMYMRDGWLVGRGNGTIKISRSAGTTSSSAIGIFYSENYMLSNIDIDGGENRAYGALTSNIALGDGSCTVSMTSGSLAVGDEVAIYNVNDTRRRKYGGYRDYTDDFSNMDEGFDVVGVNGSTVYLGMRNGTRGTIKEVTTSGSQKILNVDTASSMFEAGDKVVIGNAVYTIDSISDSSYVLYDYDFTNPSTSLSDFWVDDSTHVYSSGWSIDSGIGLKNNVVGYRELVHKYCWRRDVIIEAHMSPLDGYSTGTRGTNDFGILTSYDPAFRWGHRGFDSFKSDYFNVDEAGDRIYFAIRAMSNYLNNRLSRDTTLRDTLRVPAVYEINNSKNKTRVTINGNLLTEEFRFDGAFKGLVGLFHDSNTSFRCARFIIKAPTQLITITTANSISADTMIYRTGAECTHSIGDKIVKIASTNTGGGNHADLAFAYRGQRGNGEWPLMIQANGVNYTNSSMPYIHNHDMNIDYYYNLGDSNSERSMTVDLGSQKTFTHVSFVPRVWDYATYYGFNGVTIYGSNDLSSWTTLYGPTNDTKKWYYRTANRMAFYPTGTVSYRYVKFATQGDQAGTPYTNRYVNIGVHNFSAGYTISLNNASDFAIGDKLTVMSDSGWNWGSREIEAYYAIVSSGNSDPETFWHGGWLQECTITNKSGNTLYLDKPIFWGYVEGDDSVTVVKTNKNFTITGEIGASASFADWRWPNIQFSDGASVARRNNFRNTRFDYIGSYRYSGSTDYTRGLLDYANDYYNLANFDGTVWQQGPDGATFNGVGSYAGHMILRNSTVIGHRSVWARYNASIVGSAFFNNKILGVYSTQIYDLECYFFNYNEIATCDTGLILSTMRTSRNVLANFNEIRRNLVKGTSNYGFGLYGETVGPRRVPRTLMEYNKVRGSDDYAVVGQSFGGSPLYAFDCMADHTGSRVSRYRNEGTYGQGDTSSDLSYALTSHNYARFGYDMVFGLYHTLMREHDEPDIIKVFNPNGDDYLSIFGIEFEVYENDIPIQVYVKFDYQYSHLLTLQDDGANDGQLRCYAVENGVIIQTNWGVVPSSAGLGWNTFEATFTFANTLGPKCVYLSKDAQNSFIRFKNSTAYILTDYPDSVNVIGNTFNHQRVWDQYHEKKDMRRKTTSGTRATKLRRIKF